MIKDFSLKTLELAINTALKMDTQYIDKLTPLAHHSVELIVMPFQISFFMAFREDHITLSSTQNKPADTIIQSSPMGFIRLSFLPSSKARSLFNDKIRISGNTELGMAIKKLFDGLDLDWEGHIASFTGDIVAHQIGQFVQKTQDKCEGFRKKFTPKYE
jgi:ubiquinone biosynthesis protein UbiJ